MTQPASPSWSHLNLSTDADRAELAAYETPLAQFRGGDFKGSLPGFQQFVARYPASAYAPAAQYWIGSAHYAIKDYKSAIAAHRTLIDFVVQKARGWTSSGLSV